MIADEITKKIGEALKSHDEIRLSTLRMLSSALNYEKIAKQHSLSDEEELAVVRRAVKQRNDTIESLRSAQGKKSTSSPAELADKLKREETELLILKEYLPEEMGEEDLVALVEEVIKEVNALDIKDMGKVIGAVKTKSGGRADGAKIAEIVKRSLGTSS